MNRIDLKQCTTEELGEIVKSLGEKSFRAKQIYEWMHVKLVRSIDDMSNLSKALRERLKADYDYTSLKEITRQESQLDGTKKFLFGLNDKNAVESVLMPYRDWNTVCISSQVGCNMGCRFCASTLGGCVRNMTAAEMLDEVYIIQHEEQKRVSRVVVMGSGEPLDNYDNLVRFIKMLSDENGLNISQRNITVSTCGLVERINDLAKENFGINLALSLHAPTDEKRKKIMPIANKYTVKETVGACREYFKATGRQVTFEYALCKGVNDSEDDAKELANLIEGMGAEVNLIPVNPVRERSFERPDRKGVLAFKNKLEKMRINVTIRREMGRDIDGACGQLRRRAEGGTV
ncbi:MAG: 23S rRNA (adenine(2503)-C(2))-methyltransferase RlmN [Lachnospiraceae bacterium]|nr:23S rRNA (adenine(2503)-C(2))-methyltransferase RlmN [Lachnospiraceae bacterium]